MGNRTATDEGYGKKDDDGNHGKRDADHRAHAATILGAVRAEAILLLVGVRLAKLAKGARVSVAAKTVAKRAHLLSVELTPGNAGVAARGDATGLAGVGTRKAGAADSFSAHDVDALRESWRRARRFILAMVVLL